MLLPNPEAVGTLLFVEDVRLELLAVVLPHFRFNWKSNQARFQSQHTHGLILTDVVRHTDCQRFNYWDWDIFHHTTHEQLSVTSHRSLKLESHIWRLVVSVNIEIARNCTDALVKLSLCPEGLMAVCFCICTAVFSQAVVTWNSVVDIFI